MSKKYYRANIPICRSWGIFPLGSHLLNVQVTDGCGNVGSASLPFTVIDCAIPLITCYSDVVYNLVAVAEGTDADNDGDEDRGAIEVFAADLAIATPATDCSLPLIYSINRVGEMPDINQSSLILTCDERFMVDVEIYLWDSAFNPMSIQPDSTLGGPNYTYCETTVFIQDPDGVCPECEIEDGPDGLTVNCNDEIQEVADSEERVEDLGIGELDGGGFHLYQNKPNPFMNQTIIGFKLPKPSQVQLVVHDITGRVVNNLKGEFPAGYNEWRLDRGDMPYGILYYTIKTDQDQATRKMLLVE